MVKNPMTDFVVPSELTPNPFSIQLHKLLLTLRDHTTREEASCCCCESNAFGLSPDGQLVTPARGSDATGKRKRNSKAPLTPQLVASVILAALWICPWQYLSFPAPTFYRWNQTLTELQVHLHGLCQLLQDGLWIFLFLHYSKRPLFLICVLHPENRIHFLLPLYLYMEELYLTIWSGPLS